MEEELAYKCERLTGCINNDPLIKMAIISQAKFLDLRTFLLVGKICNRPTHLIEVCESVCDLENNLLKIFHLYLLLPFCQIHVKVSIKVIRCLQTIMNLNGIYRTIQVCLTHIPHSNI